MYVCTYLLHVGEVVADGEEVLVGPLAPVREGVHQRTLIGHVLHSSTYSKQYTHGGQRDRVTAAARHGAAANNKNMSNRLQHKSAYS